MTDRRGDGSIDPEIVKQLARDVDSAKAVLDDGRSEMGNLYKNAENDHGIHRQAFKWANKLATMEPLKRANWLRSFQSYCHILGVDAQHELDLGGDSTEQAEAA